MTLEKRSLYGHFTYNVFKGKTTQVVTAYVKMLGALFNRQVSIKTLLPAKLLILIFFLVVISKNLLQTFSLYLLQT